ncbi:YtrH family sporulation protein [Thermoflavimicrobium dichotomicum]|uniref:Sporulation protein YtrH n=1 Tax=Thermoflavimicrobium dichotomicum TaxID=46223 RepID=A0A1I3LDK3_9BACL|nr:YtrH family sporulation protein [Thermoflavimicrobium dichotomicum]SFI82767.1 Sporulation protein YtrH [Thermoflavimicrobium dichotomicum]
MEQQFWQTTILDFFIALGVVLGGVALGGLGAFLTNDYPTERMLRLAEQLKIWAMVAALGGTFDTIRAIEVNVLGGQLGQAGQQLAFIVSSFIGAHIGVLFIRWFFQGEI